jgi:hypothetical protein
MADDDTTPPEGAKPAGNPGTRKLPDDHPLVTAYARTKQELAAANDRIRAAEDAEKTELQKLQEAVAERDQQLNELPATVRQQAIRFASHATALGFLDPEDALVFVGDVDLADNDAVKAALEGLAQRKPHLVRTGTTPKVPARPKPADGTPAEGGLREGTTGKRRAAEALRTLAIN